MTTALVVSGVLAFNVTVLIAGVCYMAGRLDVVTTEDVSRWVRKVMP